MKTSALIFGVLAACAVVLQAHESGPLLTALRPSKPELQLNKLERVKRTLPILEHVLRGIRHAIVGVHNHIFGPPVTPAPFYFYAGPPDPYYQTGHGHGHGYFGPGAGATVYGDGFFGPRSGAPGYGDGFFGPRSGAPGYGDGFFGHNGNYGLANGRQPMPNNDHYRTGTGYYGPGNGDNGPTIGITQRPVENLSHDK